MSRFKKGRSGNPAGRPKGFAGLAAEIRKRTDDGVELVAFAERVFRDESAKLADRWAALQWLSDRGFGKPLASIELHAAIEPTTPTTLDVSKLSPTEQRQALELIRRMRALPAADDELGER